ICDALLYRLDVLGGLLGRRRYRRGWAVRPLAGLGKRRAAGKDQWQQAYETCHVHGRLSTGCVGALERPAADSRPLLPRPSEQGASNGLADLDIGEFPDYAKRKSGTGAVTQPKLGSVAPPAPYDCRTLDLVCDVRPPGKPQPIVRKLSQEINKVACCRTCSRPHRLPIPARRRSWMPSCAGIMS